LYILEILILLLGSLLNDTFTVETAGEERLRINSSGNVGIGTDNPGVAGIDIRY
jgi:hypothetical protein